MENPVFLACMSYWKLTQYSFSKYNWVTQMGEEEVTARTICSRKSFVIQKHDTDLVDLGAGKDSLTQVSLSTLFNIFGTCLCSKNLAKSF